MYSGIFYHLISIHAPLTGSDLTWLLFGKDSKDFNPRSPYGERRPVGYSVFDPDGFQSTLPLRGATRF